jgi:hypothetical protein
MNPKPALFWPQASMRVGREAAQASDWNWLAASVNRPDKGVVRWASCTSVGSAQPWLLNAWMT